MADGSILEYTKRTKSKLNLEELPEELKSLDVVVVRDTRAGMDVYTMVLWNNQPVYKGPVEKYGEIRDKIWKKQYDLSLDDEGKLELILDLGE